MKAKIKINFFLVITLIASFLLFNTKISVGQTTASTIGNTTVGTYTDGSDSNYMNGSRFSTGSSAGTVKSMSVYVAGVSAAPNNQYQLAIYTDNNGVPGTLVAKSLTGTLTGNSWNTLSVSASLNANTNYWFMYNTNGLNSSSNNMKYNSVGLGAWSKSSVAFGTWPQSFGLATTGTLTFSIYASYTTASVTPTPTTPTPTPTSIPNSISITVSPSGISVSTISKKLNTPTYDGSGQAVHPDVYYNPNSWNGYKYWMALTPYPNGNAAYENPSILVSNDGITWVIPTGLTNPIDPKPAGNGENSDVEIVYNNNLNRLEVYYVESGAGTSYLRRRTSTDGIHWSAEENTFNLPDYQVMSPAIVRIGSMYYLWYESSANCSSSTSAVYYRTSSDGLNWSASQTVNIQKSGLVVWHADVIYITSMQEYWMVFAAYPNNSTCNYTDLYFAKSKDKINWTTYNEKIISRGSWDSSEIYRAAALYDETFSTLRIWYSARGSSTWNIGYTERPVFTSQAKDQNGNIVNLPITWSSSNTSVGTITQSGLFRAISAGSTSIKALSGTISGTATATVR